MKVRRFLAVPICMVALIAVTLLSSFAYNQSVGSVNSPLSDPTPVFTSASDFTFYMVGYFTDGRGYQLGEFHVTGLSSSDKFCVKNGFVRSSVNCSLYINIFDINTGSLLGEYSADFTQLSSPVDTYYYWSYGSIFAQINGNTGGLYYILPDTNFINVLGTNYSPAFVTWSDRPLEHNVYHSELSEPVADEFNSYFICNDRLYWLSYRANALYSFTQNFELSSQLYQEDVSYISSGQGTYAGQANGFSEPVTSSAGVFSGSSADGTVAFSGNVTPWNLGQISYVGVNTGNLRVNSNGQMTFNDLEVYPVSVNSQVLNRLFDIIVYLTDDKGFKIWLVPRSDLGQNLVLDASLYCSCFDLTNGDYISSSFSSYTGNYQYAGFDYRVDDKISSVHCYGCAFYNVNNIPVNLSDVFWGYDLEFKEWRDNMLLKLTQIYNLLSSTDSMPETTTSSFGSSVEGLSDPSYSDVSPEQVADNLNGAWEQNPNLQENSGFVKGWISEFSIPKIIALCILALASGTVILTLGKNKADT